MGLGPVMCVIVTSDNEQQSKHSRRRGLRWVEIDFMLFLCFSGGCSVHQLSWVDEIIFAVCLYLTWHKPDIDTDIRIMAPGIIGAISFNAGPWLQIQRLFQAQPLASVLTLLMMWGPRCHLSAHIVCESDVSESRESCYLSESPRTTLSGEPGRGWGMLGCRWWPGPCTGDWRQATTSEWSVKREPGEQWEQCVEWEHSVTRGTRDMWALPAVTSSDQQRLQHDVGPPGEAEIESRHLTCAGLRARARDGWKCFVFSWQKRGAEGRGQRRQPGTQAQVGGEIGQRHGNIYESNYFGTELGETQGFSSYSLGKCGCWPPLAKQFRIFEFIPDFLFTFPLSAFE